MADNYWEGSVSTVPTLAGNWSLTHVPAAAENIHFDGTAQNNCVGGDLATGVQVASITIHDDCVIDIGTSAADALDFDCNGVLENRGTGTSYLNVQNTTQWNHFGGGSHSIDGIDNDELNIGPGSGTIRVGPLAATPAEFDTTMTVKAGNVRFDYVTDQVAADTDLIVLGGTVETNDGIAAATMYAGTWTHNSGGMATPLIYGGKMKYNSGSNISGTLSAYGEFTLEDNFRGPTIAACHVFSGGRLWDPQGRATWTLPVELHGCSLGDGRTVVELGTHKKYTVAAI